MVIAHFADVIRWLGQVGEVSDHNCLSEVDCGYVEPWSRVANPDAPPVGWKHGKCGEQGPWVLGQQFQERPPVPVGSNNLLVRFVMEHSDSWRESAFDVVASVQSVSGGPDRWLTAPEELAC